MDLPSRASFHSKERIAPSNRGIKHLATERTVINRYVIPAQQEFKDALLKVGLEPASITREDFWAFLESERTKWGEVIKSRNINIE
jgi:hypothetical protein